MLSEQIKCRWAQNEDGQWDTGCGQIFEFTADGPEENGFAFCPYCGYGIAHRLESRRQYCTNPGTVWPEPPPMVPTTLGNQTLEIGGDT